MTEHKATTRRTEAGVDSTDGPDAESTQAQERAALQRDADVAAAGIESNFLRYRMLPQVIFLVGGIVLQSAFIIGSRDPAIAIPCLFGIALMVTSVWLHVTSFNARRAAAAAALRCAAYHRSGFHPPVPGLAPRTRGLRRPVLLHLSEQQNALVTDGKGGA